MDIESRVDKLISYIENTTEIKNKIFLSLEILISKLLSNY